MEQDFSSGKTLFRQPFLESTGAHLAGITDPVSDLCKASRENKKHGLPPSLGGQAISV